jgi:tyrosyl-tRNA synthetase
MAEELLSALESYSRRCASSSGGAAASQGASGGEGDWRFDLLRSVGEECQTEAELKSLLAKKKSFNLYDGFEPSGRMHIAQGVFKAINVNKCTQAGGTFIFWVADWFALMNDKMGGDLDKIKTVGLYLIEVWKASGMDMSQVKFLWASDHICGNAEAYWSQVLDIGRRTTLARVKKCCQIMGRKEDSLTAAQILYPLMQCADIFYLKADICQLGVDQRKVNMLGRDYCDNAGRKEKPVILSHHMLYGLKAGQAKMSKSDPDSAVFMEDTVEDVERKIRNAYCPVKPDESTQKAVDDEMRLVKDDLNNPCLDYVKHILFCKPGFAFNAGNKTYSTFDSVKEAFLTGEISEKVLKDHLIKEINLLLEPVRQHFTNDSTAKDLLDKVRQYKKETHQVQSALHRLKAIQPESAGEVFAVFAPLPSETVRLDAALGVLQRLRKAPGGAKLVLWLEDWTAMALGRVGGSKSCIQGFYEILLLGLRRLAPELMKAVQVCWQGQMILSGPSEYWISVINAGRKFSVEALRAGLPEGESLEYASQVVSSLMHVADAMSLVNGTSSPTLCCDKHHENLHRLAAQHFESCGLAAPKVCVVEDPALRLLQPGEGVEVDVNVMLTDTEIEVNKKVKKAFCEPGNISFCPPLVWVDTLLSFNKEFCITRKPDNGGDKTYTSLQAATEDFVSGALHPGDLKPALSKTLNAFLEGIRKGLKEEDVPAKAVKELANFVKAAAKKK